jgi:preprotein translocase subunit YajC
MNQLVVFLPLLIVLGAFMFFASRRQKRAMQATIDLHESLSIGDRVHTTSGLQGIVAHIADDTVDLEIAPGVVTTWMKLAIRDRVEPEIPDTKAAEADGLAGEAVEAIGDPERLPKD